MERLYIQFNRNDLRRLDRDLARSLTEMSTAGVPRGIRVARYPVVLRTGRRHQSRDTMLGWYSLDDLVKKFL